MQTCRPESALFTVLSAFLLAFISGLSQSLFLPLFLSVSVCLCVFVYASVCDGGSANENNNLFRQEMKGNLTGNFCDVPQTLRANKPEYVEYAVSVCECVCVSEGYAWVCMLCVHLK